MDERIYRIIAVAKPELINNIVTVIVTLKNNIGDCKKEKIKFDDMQSALIFYRQKQGVVK